MRFNGREFKFERPAAGSNHHGDSLERMIDAEMKSAAASQRALNEAKVAEKKRQREEDRTIARLYGVDIADRLEPLPEHKPGYPQGA